MPGSSVSAAINHSIFSSRFVTIQQHIFTTVRVRWLRGEFVYFPPQSGRSAISGRGNDKRRMCVRVAWVEFFPVTPDIAIAGPKSRRQQPFCFPLKAFPVGPQHSR